MTKEQEFEKMSTDTGFTIIELLTTIAILAILTAITVPGIIGWLPNYRLSSAVQDIFSNFQLAKFTAVNKNTFCTITFNQAIGSTTYDYVVYIDTDNDLEYDTGEEVIANVLWSDYRSVTFDTNAGGGDGLTFTNNNDGLPSIAFRPNGIPTGNGGGFAQGTVFLINTRNRIKSVVISQAGNIRIAD